MRQLIFTVKEQTLEKNKKTSFNGIVAGTAGYLGAKFIFYGNAWSNCKKAASFWTNGVEYPVLLDDNSSCVIPKEILAGDRFEVSLTGLKEGYIIKTNRIEVTQEVV